MASRPPIFILLLTVTIFISAVLSQNSAVRVEIIPNEVVRNYREYITFRCQAIGVRPVRQVSWSRIGGTIPGRRHFIYPSTPSNVSYLLLYNLQGDDSGIYRCTVSSAGGIGLQADAFLRVNGGHTPRYCQPNPCRNLGICSELSDSYRCACSAPYTGRNCELVDQCLLQPCQNDGLCQTSSNGDGFQCTCQLGFTGRRCEQEDACSSSPCLNNGVCQSSNTGGVSAFSCHCISGFTGELCATHEVVTPSTPCSSSPCLNSGTCFDVPLINSYVCVCATGFQGGNCQFRKARVPLNTMAATVKPVDNCLSLPCLNGATCLNNPNSFSCRCAQNYTGQFCEQRDSCFSNPCHHGGSCRNVGNGYQCACSSEFMGHNCETYNWCHNSPCQNGASCRNDMKMHSFECTCLDGYTGKTCAKRDFCVSSPCYSGGVCENLNTTFRCSCPDGYLGERCERTPEPGECAKYGQKMSSGELRDFFYTETLRTTKPAADIIFVVDESASMVTEHGWLKEVSNALDNSLKEHLIGTEVPNQFGLVGFAKDSPMDMKGRVIEMENGRKFGRAEEFSKATRRLALNGRLEDLYLGITMTLDHYDLRPGMACQIIGVTDEGRYPLTPSSRHSNYSSTPYEYDYVYERLIAKGCVLNVVINQQMKSGEKDALGIGSQGQGYVEAANGMFVVEQDQGKAVEITGHGSTHKDYTVLALATRGGAWDLNKLRKGGNVGMAFTKAFVHLKQREISRQLCERCTCDAGPIATCREGCLGEPPTLVEISSIYNRLSTAAVNEGSSAMFMCDASGDPAPTCMWEYADGRSLPQEAEYFGEGGCQVRVPEVTSTTCVRCIASNIEGTSESSVQCVDYVAACQFADNRKIFHGSSARNYSEIKKEDLPRIPFSSAVVVLVVDESGSMVGEHNWLKSTMPALEKNLANRGVGVSGRSNQYALVGFASPRTRLGHVIRLGRGLDCGTANEVSEALQLLRRDGRREDGYSAIGVALSSLSCVSNRRRNTTALQVILVTDEDRDRLDANWQYESIRQEIVRHGGILNVVVQNQFHGKNDRMQEVRALGIDRRQRAVVANSNKDGYYFLPMGQPTKDTAHGTTEQDYVNLAMHTGGGAWDLGMLRDGTYREAFTLGFIAAKVEEIQIQILSRCHECLCLNGTLECRLLPAVNTEQGCLNPVANPNIDVRVLGEVSATATVGDFAEMECVATAPASEGTPAVVWRPHHSSALQYHQKLEFASVTMAESGQYTCEVRTENGMNSASVELSVVQGVSQPRGRQSSGLQQHIEEQGPEQHPSHACVRSTRSRRSAGRNRRKWTIAWDDHSSPRVMCCSGQERAQQQKVTVAIPRQKGEEEEEVTLETGSITDLYRFLDNSKKRHYRVTCLGEKTRGLHFYVSPDRLSVTGKECHCE